LIPRVIHDPHSLPKNTDSGKSKLLNSYDPFEKVMTMNPMDVLRQWALQTVTYAITIENAAVTGISKELVEQNAIPASQIANRLFAESVAACGSDGERVDRMLVELGNRVLDWVAERRGQAARS
jgi:hypothetical protein